MNFRSRHLLDLCRGQPCYLRIPGTCTGGGEDTVACHSNQAKHGHGKAEKAGDQYTVPGCAACHRELDQGIRLCKQEKSAIWDRAYWLWDAVRWCRGLVVVAGHSAREVAPREKPLRHTRLSSRKVLPHPGVPV